MPLTRAVLGQVRAGGPGAGGGGSAGAGAGGDGSGFGGCLAAVVVLIAARRLVGDARTLM